MNRSIYALAIALAALLCEGNTAKAQSYGYYYQYHYYYGGTAYPLPTAYYTYYPSYIYPTAPPVWFTPPAPPTVVININVTPTVVTPVIPAIPAAPVREWKTVYPVWPKKFGVGTEFGNEFWLGKERYKLHEGPDVPSLPSGRKPTEMFVSTYTRDSMEFLEYHHVGGKTSLFKKVSK